MEPSADLQAARQGCVELGHRTEGIAELVLPLLRQATQELGRMEAQRDELRKSGTREAQQAVLPRLLERIEEQGQNVKRLERASRSLKELISALGGLAERLQSGLARHDEEQRELEAIAREEKRMWLQELNTLREQVRGPGGPDKPAGPSTAQQEELQRLRAENETLPKLRAERDRLAHRVAELEKNLATREQSLTAKEQTIEDLRRMIALLTGDTAPPAPSPPRPVPAPGNVVNLSARVPAPPRPAENMFGDNTMLLATSMLETLGEGAPVSPPPVPAAAPPVAPGRKVPSREIMLGPLDDLESPPPSLPPPVPVVPPVPGVSRVPAKASLMPKASARVVPPGPALTPAPVPVAPRPSPARPPPARPSPERAGTLVISEDMFNELLVEENNLGGSGKK
jgi:hypothetical protein